MRFDNELTQALEEAENERDQKDKVSQENATLGAQIYTLRQNLQVCVHFTVCVRFYKTMKTSSRDQIMTQLPVSQIV